MKKIYTLAFILVWLLNMSGCAVIGRILHAGAAVGVLAAVFLIAFFLWIVLIFRSKSK